VQHLLDRLASSAPPGSRKVVNAVQVGVSVVVVAYAISTMTGRQDAGFNPLLDGWLQVSGYVMCAVLIAMRPALSSLHRRLWVLGALAIAFRSAGFVAFVPWLRTLDPVPYPSLADVGWLGMYVFVAIGLADLARTRFLRITSALAFDGLIGAAATAGVAVAVLPGDVRELNASHASHASDAAVAVNALYPVLDVGVLILVLGMLIGFHWRPPRAMWVFGVGVSLFAITDAVYVHELARGAYRPGGLLSALSLIGTAIVAGSAWTPVGEIRRGGRDYLPGLVVPSGLTLVCLGLLVRAAFVDTPTATVILATVGMAGAVIRTALSFRDVRHLAEARRESRTDDLTGLANRRSFNEALAKAMRGRPSTDPLAVLLLDLDGFKDVNDSLGHHRGDELLTLVAPRIEIAVRPEDRVARIGGDEFAVLLEGVDGALAADVAERLRSTCRGPFTLASRSITVGVSVGIARFPDDGIDSNELLQHADMAMYAAKDERSGHSFYRPEHHIASEARLEGIAELRGAIESGQIILHYQPKVDLRTGAIFGVEALVRWQHPSQGLLPPVAFLQQAESGGLMRQLTMHVLERAVVQWSRWHGAGVETSIAVNLSVGDLLDRQFPAQVVALLEAHDVPGRAILFELTEDLLLADPTRGHAVIAELLRHDVRVQVDDYGTGYSTLGYLRDLPELGGLKLDRSFVTNLPQDERSVAIVESTIALAASLGLELIAEGVETAEARDKLLELGCHLAQGYYFSKPVPADDIPFGSVLPA
jgi:diguanylate cyclase (GGDEF)-like protein